MKQKRLLLYVFGAFAFASAARLAAELPETTLISGTLTPGLLGQADTSVPAQPAVTPPATEPKPLWQPSEFFQSLQFRGYVESSYTFNFNRPGGNENVGRIFDTQHNEFMLNTVLLEVGKPATTDSWVGFKVTPVVGQDASVTQAIGLFRDTDGTSDSDFDIHEAKILLLCPKTDTLLTIGKFITSAGAEVIQSPLNSNFSRSFLFGLAIPFTHTGITVTQPVKRDDGSDIIAFTAGIANGWDNVKDLNEDKVILTNVFWTPCSEFSLAANFFYSFSEQTSAAGPTGAQENHRTLFDFVATIDPFDADSGPLDGLKFILNLDWAEEEGAHATDGTYAQWGGFAGIAHYKVNDQWYAAFRGEYFGDPQGARTSSFTGDGAELVELTWTLGWQPVSSLLLRAELRWDKASDQIFAEERDAGEKSTQTTAALEALFLF